MSRQLIVSVPAQHPLAFGLLLLLLLSNICHAETKKSKIVAPANIPLKPLILSPSSEWQNQQLNRSYKPDFLSEALTPSASSGKANAKKLDVGCDVDLAPQTLDKDRLANRFVGECRLGYNY